MSLKLIFDVIVISGIFGKKHDELDILPPPPPFPEIEKGSRKVKDARKIREQQEKQKQKEIQLKRKEDLQEKKRKELEEKKRLKEKQGKEKLNKGKKKAKGKTVFKFFHNLGLVKTEKEKKQYGLKKQKEKEQKELENRKNIEKRMKEEGERKKQKSEAKRQMELKRKRIFEEREEEKRKAEIEKKRQKEFNDLDKIAPEPVKERRAKKVKLKTPELISLKTKEFEKKIGEHEEIAKEEEEIQKAIGGIKKAKKPSVVKELFKKKKPIEEKIETPEVMPRTYDKIDYVESIERKMHKARLALMDFKFDEAKSVYIEIMKMYKELDPKKRSKVYQDIKDLYYERKSAEKYMK